MKKRFKQQKRKSATTQAHENVSLRFRNIEAPTQACLERMGITTHTQLREAVDVYGVEGLIARMEDAGYTPPKHEKWRIMGAVRNKDWKIMLKELRAAQKARRRTNTTKL